MAPLHCPLQELWLQRPEIQAMPEAELEIGEKITRIIRTHEVAAKPLSVDDAAIEVDETKAAFLVFRNAETQPRPGCFLSTSI